MEEDKVLRFFVAVSLCKGGTTSAPGMVGVVHFVQLHEIFVASKEAAEGEVIAWLIKTYPIADGWNFSVVAREV